MFPNKQGNTLFIFDSYFSMGGAIAVHVAAKSLLKTLVGLVVIDVVEGN